MSDHTAERAEPFVTWRLRNGAWSTSDVPLRRVFPGLSSVNDRLEIKVYDLEEAGTACLRTSPQIIQEALRRSIRWTDAAAIAMDYLWGTYVIVVFDKATQMRHFFSDPLQSARLHYCVAPRGELAIDLDLTRLVRLNGVRWNVDFLEHYARTQFCMTGKTAFAGIDVVPAGAALSVTRNGDVITTDVWKPKRFLGTDSQMQCEDAIETVFSNLVNQHPSISVALSGGVDSSAAAIFLRRALGHDSPFPAVNYYSTASPEAYEVDLARQVAESIGAELICIDIEKHLPFSDLKPAAAPFSPSQDMLFLSLEKELTRILPRGTVLMEGQAGDMLFNAIPTAAAVVDALEDVGPGFGLDVAQRLALLRNDSVFEILQSAAKVAYSRSSFGKWRRQPEFGRLFHPSRRRAEREARNSGDGYTREPLGTSEDELVKSIKQFVTIMPSASERTQIRRLNPFLSQPVVEAAMTIKSYDSSSQQNDRIALRQAAYSVRQLDVLWRRTKGTFDLCFLKGVSENQVVLG
jgi:asparagine synthetase B (glutamine-hydrolysing)